MFNPWALLFFVVLFCVLFVLIEFTLLIAQELQYLLRLLVLVLFCSCLKRQIRRGRILRPFLFLTVVIFPFFSIVSRFRGINGKKLTFVRLQFCPTFQSLF
uniref:(northern house mosquito) hypothetical protein n=1 Tax=Culex pipiens TaxID=7175 RepID=A0A8D8AIF5_CULPI